MPSRALFLLERALPNLRCQRNSIDIQRGEALGFGKEPRAAALSCLFANLPVRQFGSSTGSPTEHTGELIII